jgi:6-pyruvoyl-tetrahydropterin synthase related domain
VTKGSNQDLTSAAMPGSNLEQPDRESRSRDHLVPCLGILLLASVIMIPVFVKGFPEGYDAVRHYRWTSQFIEAVRDGALYPRWLPGANDGQGSPVPLYYPPLPFYVAAGFSLVTGNTLQAISLSCWLALALSGLTMYGFSRSFLSSGLSFAAAAMYMLAPYHILDLYQGSTVSEFWTLAWVPLLFEAVRRASTSPGLPAIAYLAPAYALLVFTHVPLLLLTSLTLVIFAVLLTRNARALLSVAGGLALGAGIGAIFLIPVLFESRYIRLFFKFDYREYFLFEHLRTLLTSSRFPSETSPFNYLIDVELVAIVLLPLFVVSSLLIAINRRGVKDHSRGALRLAIWVVTAVSLLMTTRLSAPIWRMTPGLSYLFFPYRWLLVASAGTCCLTALAIRTVMGDQRWRFVKIGALVIAVILNLAVSALAIWRAPHTPEGLEGGLSRRDTREYRPVWWYGQLNRELWQSPALIESGDADVAATDDSGIKQSYSFKAGTESVIAIRPLYFPGWVSRVDGKQIDVGPSADGHIQITVEPGEHTLTLSFEDTRPRTAGKLVSAFSLLVWLAMLWGSRKGMTRSAIQAH